MNYLHYNLRLYFYYAAAILIFAGCAPEIREPVEVVPGKESIAEALSVLKARSQNAVPLLAKGRCVLKYYDEDKKERKESLPMVRVVMNPPVEIYLQGDATIVPKAIVLGSNGREFWLALKPKEISTYWWGQWSEQVSSEGLTISPRTVLEAIGVVEIKAEENWSLSNEGAFDVLTRRERGVVIKKIYISSRDYLVKKIEYFDSNGQAVAYTELEGYKEVSDGFFVPALIKIIAYGQNNSEESLNINLDLKSIRPKEITEGMQNFYFNRPKPRGFKHILVNEGGKWIEQQQ
ncbi:MAG: hypothetical protein ACETWQ_08715 [Phycisphaerae bacterium]